ncbi:MAG: hypothetical protein PHQ52_03495 [Candidatus Omnitrophica bacterium]|nr:hypothetical protein [Candidatus Omnitrophota bacterium]
MKKYIQPKIKSVELDPDQAILQVCVVAGVYLSLNPSSCVGSQGTSGPAPMICTAGNRARGPYTGVTTTRWSASGIPS